MRPGTFEAFLRHLDENRRKPEAERYHVVHFDTHGALLTYDELNLGITFRNLARLWRASGDDRVIVETAGVLGISAEEVQAMFEQV